MGTEHNVTGYVGEELSEKDGPDHGNLTSHVDVKIKAGAGSPPNLHSLCETPETKGITSKMVTEMFAQRCSSQPMCYQWDSPIRQK